MLTMRPLLPRERALLIYVLEPGRFEGARELNDQIDLVRVQGSATSLWVHTSPGAPAADLIDGDIPGRAIVVGDDGEPTGWIMVRTYDGLINRFAYEWRVPGEPTEMPSVDRIRLEPGVAKKQSEAPPFDNVAFEKSVMKIVAPYLATFGLAPVSSDSGKHLTRVDFASQTATASLYRETYSGSQGIHFDRIGSRAKRQINCSISWAAKATGKPLGSRSFMDHGSRSGAAVREGLEQLVADLQEYCEPALRGDRAFYKAMTDAMPEPPPGTIAQRLRRVQAMQADAAIARRDWASVVEIYGSATFRLSGGERRRLELARAHLKSR